MNSQIDNLLDVLEDDLSKINPPTIPSDRLQRPPDTLLFAMRLEDIILALREIRRQFYLHDGRISAMESPMPSLTRAEIESLDSLEFRP